MEKLITDMMGWAGVTKEELEDVLQKEVILSHAITEKLKEGEKARSPGMKYKHYAPKCEMQLHMRAESAYEAFLSQKNAGKRVILLGMSKYLKYEPSISLGENSVDYANRLFNALRDAEKEADYIIAIAPTDDEVGRSVMNRIEKSCGGNIIK